MDNIREKLTEFANTGFPYVSTFNIVNVEKVTENSFLFLLKPKFILLGFFPNISEIEVTLSPNEMKPFKIKYYFNFIVITLFFLGSFLIFFSADDNVFRFLVLCQTILLVWLKISGFNHLKKAVQNSLEYPFEHS